MKRGALRRNDANGNGSANEEKGEAARELRGTPRRQR